MALPCPRNLAIIFALSFLVGLSPALASETASKTICRLDSRGGTYPALVDCPTETNPWGSSLHIDENFAGARANGNWTAKTPIDVHGVCRFVDTKSDKDGFVPFKTDKEWSQFNLHYPPAVFNPVHCARPFSGINEPHTLYFGQTSANFGAGDQGDAIMAPVDLPYWRTGTSWPPYGKYEHTFNNSCYGDKPAADPVCRETNDLGECTKWGHDCERKWYSWSEVFYFSASAFDSEHEDPSWGGSSSRESGCRPTECYTRCEVVNGDCSCSSTPAMLCPTAPPPDTPPPTPPNTCDASLPSYGSCLIWLCSFFENNVPGCMMFASENMQAQSDLTAALQANDCTKAQAVVAAYSVTLNNAENGFCSATAASYNACVATGGGSTGSCIQAATTDGFNYCAANNLSLDYTSP